MTTNPTTIVPTKEMCIRAREEGYPQGRSYFVWVHRTYRNTWKCMPRFDIPKYVEIEMLMGRFNDFEVFDAPTLQEIFDEVTILMMCGFEISFEKIVNVGDENLCDVVLHWWDNINFLNTPMKVRQ